MKILNTINTNLQEPFNNFRYGRKDCVSSNHTYKAFKKEVQPDPNAAGVTTQNFFKENFNFNPRETVAIMGAHTLV